MAFLPGFDPGTQAERAERTLAERFGVPPFSVLDARGGVWQERKRAWLMLGIESEVGRKAQAYASPQAAALAGGYLKEDGAQKSTSTSSVFDPTLCELVYYPNEEAARQAAPGGARVRLVTVTEGGRIFGEPFQTP